MSLLRGIEQIEIHNFKSYRGYTLVGPFRPFTAIVGPNGSGKSNIADALIFCLGINTNKIRADKLKDLVNIEALKEDEQPIAWVELHFRESPTVLRTFRRTISLTKGSTSSKSDASHITIKTSWAIDGTPTRHKNEYLSALAQIGLGFCRHNMIFDSLNSNYNNDSDVNELVEQLVDAINIYNMSVQSNNSSQQTAALDDPDASPDAPSVASAPDPAAPTTIGSFRSYQLEPIDALLIPSTLDPGVKHDLPPFILPQAHIATFSQMGSDQLYRVVDATSGNAVISSMLNQMAAIRTQVNHDLVRFTSLKARYQKERGRLLKEHERYAEYLQKREEYSGLMDEYYLIMLYFYDRHYRPHVERVEQAQKDLGEQSTMRQRKHEQLSKYEQEFLSIRREFNTHQRSLAHYQQALDAPQQAKAKLSQTVHAAQETIRRIKATSKTVSKEIKGISTKITDDKAELALKEELLKTLDAEYLDHADDGSSRKGKGTTLAEKKHEFLRLQAELETTLRNETSTKKKQYHDLKHREVETTKRLDALGKKHDLVQRQLDTARASISQLRLSLAKTTEEDYAQVQSNIKMLECQKQECEQRLKNIDSQQRDLQTRLKHHQQQYIRYTAIRHRIHQEKRTQDAVKSLIQIFGPNYVFGRLSSLITPIDKQYHTSLGAALGRYNNAVVVHTPQIALQCIEYLSENKLSPLIFLPVHQSADAIPTTGDSQPPVSLSTKQTNIRQFIMAHREARMLSDVLEYSSTFHTIISKILGHVVLVNTLELCEEVAFSDNHIGAKYVTLDGDIIHVNKYITYNSKSSAETDSDTRHRAKPTKKKNSDRRRQQSHADTALAVHLDVSNDLDEEDELLVSQQRLPEVDQILHETQSKIEEISNELASLTLSLSPPPSDMQSDISRSYADVSVSASASQRLFDQIQAITARLSRLEYDRQTIETTIAKTRQQLETEERRFAQHQQQLQDLDTEITALQKEQSMINTELEQFNAHRLQLEEQLFSDFLARYGYESVESAAEHLVKRHQHYQDQQFALKLLINRLTATIAFNMHLQQDKKHELQQLENEIAQISSTIQEAERTVKSLDAKLSSTQAKIDEIAAIIQEKEERMKTSQDAIEIVSKDLLKVDAAYKQSELELKTATDRLVDLQRQRNEYIAMAQNDNVVLPTLTSASSGHRGGELSPNRPSKRKRSSKEESTQDVSAQEDTDEAGVHSQTHLRRKKPHDTATPLFSTYDPPAPHFDYSSLKADIIEMTDTEENFQQLKDEYLSIINTVKEDIEQLSYLSTIFGQMSSEASTSTDQPASSRTSAQLTTAATPSQAQLITIIYRSIVTNLNIIMTISKVIDNLEEVCQQIQHERFQSTVKTIQSTALVAYQYITQGGLLKLSVNVLAKQIILQAKPYQKQSLSLASTLSGGEKAVVSVCLVLGILQAMSCSLAILDEFDANLDFNVAKRLASFIRTQIDAAIDDDDDAAATSESSRTQEMQQFGQSLMGSEFTAKSRILQDLAQCICISLKSEVYSHAHSLVGVSNIAGNTQLFTLDLSMFQPPR